MLQTDRMVQRNPASTGVTSRAALGTSEPGPEALGLAWAPTASPTSRDGLQRLLAVARVDAAMRDAQAHQETFCRVLFRCLDGWTVLDMKALAKDLRATHGCRVQAQADLFETDPNRRHVWLELAW